MLKEPIYVVDGARTPFLKARGKPGPWSASDLAVVAGRHLLNKVPTAQPLVDEVILGCAAPSADEVNIGRYVAMRLGLGNSVPGYTVMRNCASGMQAIDSGIDRMLAGRANVILAGGVDALSRTPLNYSDKMVLWFAQFSGAKTMGQKAGMFAKLPVGEMFAPVITLMRGLTDPMVGLIMGQTAENLAQLLRKKQDISTLKLRRCSTQKVRSTPPTTACGKTLPPPI
jgi:acetyl-CoA C-acetyltransferase